MADPARDQSSGRRVDLVALSLASLAVLVACFVEAAWSAWLFVAALAVFPVALSALGARRGADGRLGRQAVPILLLFVVQGASLAGLLFLHLRGAGDGGVWLGLPAPVALLVYGLFLAPLVVTTLGYAWTFDRGGLGADSDGDR